MSNAQKAAERLGVVFAKCSHCEQQFVWREEEVFSVIQKSPDSDYDDGNSDAFFCCSHVCASKLHATLPAGRAMIWRSGACGGSSMPSLEEL